MGKNVNSSFKVGLSLQIITFRNSIVFVLRQIFYCGSNTVKMLVYKCLDKVKAFFSVKLRILHHLGYGSESCST